MNAKKTLLLIVLVVAAAAMSSCSGLGNVCTTNCGGGSGDALLSMTMSDTPPTNTAVMSFTLPVIGITLTPSSGSPVSVYSSGNYELTRLQSDTSLLATNVKVTAGSYTSVNVTVSAPSGVYVNGSGATLGACVSGAICSITGSAATITYTFPSALTLTANSDQWLNLDFNYNNAVVTNSSGAVGIDVTQTGVITASSTVPAGVASGNFANIDDFTGQITALSSSSITITSDVRGSVTAGITSSTVWFDPQGLCSGGASSSCVGVGSVVSLQGLLSTSGVVTASSLDIIDNSTSPSDEVEGIIYPTSTSSCSGGYGLILADSVINTSGSPLSGQSFGTGVCLTLGGTATYAIDTGILTGQSSVPLNGIGFHDSADILAGQVVRAKISGATTTSGIINATANLLLLRFSRLTGTVSSTTGTSLYVTGLPAYVGTFSTPPQVYTYVGATLFEGQSSVGSLTGTVSMSTLYLNVTGGAQYWFQAAKVRQQ
jgi:hypothetical protein